MITVQVDVNTVQSAASKILGVYPRITKRGKEYVTLSSDGRLTYHVKRTGVVKRVRSLDQPELIASHGFENTVVAASSSALVCWDMTTDAIRNIKLTSKIPLLCIGVLDGFALVSYLDGRILAVALDGTVRRWIAAKLHEPLKKFCVVGNRILGLGGHRLYDFSFNRPHLEIVRQSEPILENCHDLLVCAGALIITAGNLLPGSEAMSSSSVRWWTPDLREFFPPKKSRVGPVSKVSSLALSEIGLVLGSPGSLVLLDETTAEQLGGPLPLDGRMPIALHASKAAIYAATADGYVHTFKFKNFELTSPGLVH